MSLMNIFYDDIQLITLLYTLRIFPITSIAINTMLLDIE